MAYHLLPEPQTTVPAPASVANFYRSDQDYALKIHTRGRPQPLLNLLIWPKVYLEEIFPNAQESVENLSRTPDETVSRHYSINRAMGEIILHLLRSESCGRS